MAADKTKILIKSIFYIALGFMIAIGGATAANKKLYYRSFGKPATAFVVTKYKNLYLEDPTLKSGKNSFAKNYFFQLHFFDHNGNEYMTDTPVYYTTWQKYSADMPLEILYNPKEPGKNVIIVSDHRAVSIGLEVFFTLLGLLMIYFGLSIVDKKEWFWVNKGSGIRDEGS